jgi:predicted GNAT superfamily acetyltransferase
MSTLKVNAISNVAGTGSPNITEQAKAWVNFNGTGTVAIRADYNVTSITDNGTGTYTVNFTNAMADANYAGVATCNVLVTWCTNTQLCCQQVLRLPHKCTLGIE